MGKSRLLVSILAVASPAAWGTDFVCPRELPTEQKLAAPLETGWRVFLDKVDERHFLSGIALYDGPPEELANLAPDNEDAATNVPSFWTVRPTAERRLWMVCVYQDTSLRLARELPVAITKCTQVYSRKPGTELIALRCT